MPGSSTPTVARAVVTARGARDWDAHTYDRHAVGLYRQALLTFGDMGLVGVSRQERGALGLALSGGRGHVQASQEAAISAVGMAAVLRKLAAFAPDPQVPTGQRLAES
jgi:hypothetical protein